MNSDFAYIVDAQIEMVSANGSYILPSGIVVLVELDVETYENGTLVFYNINNIPSAE